MNFWYFIFLTTKFIAAARELRLENSEFLREVERRLNAPPRQCLKSPGWAGGIFGPSRPGPAWPRRILNSSRLFRGFKLVLGVNY